MLEYKIGFQSAPPFKLGSGEHLVQLVQFTSPVVAKYANGIIFHGDHDVILAESNTKKAVYYCLKYYKGNKDNLLAKLYIADFSDGDLLDLANRSKGKLPFNVLKEIRDTTAHLRERGLIQRLYADCTECASKKAKNS